MISIWKKCIIRWIFLVIILGFLTGCLCLTVKWALIPGYWSGSWLDSSDKPLLTVVQERFGPILLQRAWILDPEGVWGSRQDVIQMWGARETTFRLLLIIGALLLILCIFIVSIKLRSGTCKGVQTDSVIGKDGKIENKNSEKD